jgi:isocitrate/isopropylmalate dehydrogenase
VKIAVIPGDGIGNEVVSAILPILSVLDSTYDLDLRYDVFDWGADKWLAEGVGLPPGSVEMLSTEYDAVLFGALGDPRVPDMAHGREILLGLRRGLDLYINYRPVILPTGRIDIYRENTQGLYSGVGGTVKRGSLADVAIDECIYTRHTVERFVNYCLRELSKSGHTRVTLIHKSNAVPNTGALWQEVFYDQRTKFPELDYRDEYVDSFCYRFIRDPSAYEGVLAPNLLGDIVSDIGAALMGSIGMAASANICPESGFGLFEPVHGSAPDIAGTGLANPYGAAMSLVLLLENFDMSAPAAALRSALDHAAQGTAATPDLGGSGTTRTFMARVHEFMARVHEAMLAEDVR